MSLDVHDKNYVFRYRQIGEISAVIINKKKFMRQIKSIDEADKSKPQQ